jgi:outer membrane protein insertion porin family
MICLISWVLFPVALAAQQPYAAPVGTIAIEGAPQTVLEAIPIRSGDVLSAESIRASIQALFDVGGYGRINVEASETAGGTTALTFLVEEPYFLATVILSPATLLERPLSNYLDLPHGQRFSRSQLDEIVTAVGEQLEREGYFQVEVRPTYEVDDQSQLVTVTVSVSVGTPARIRSLQFEGGEQTFSEAELENAFGVEAGDTFVVERLEAGTENIRSDFAELGFLNTRVDFFESYDEAENVVDLRVVAEPGPFTLVQLRGYEVDDSVLRDLVPVFEEGSVDPDLIEEGRVGLLEYLRREGYFEASVAAELIAAPRDNAFQINYIVSSGERYSVREVRIEGHRFFDDDLLYDAIGISGNGLFSQGVFSPELLENASETLARMYAAAGFAATRVEPNFSIEANGITAVLQVEEGSQLEIGEVYFLGNTLLDDAGLVRIANLASGGLFIPAAVEEARGAITSNYHRRGYPDVRVRSSIDRSANGDRVDVSYSLEEGTRYAIGTIFVAGNTRTKEKVVHRNSQLAAGDAYDPEAILQAQQRLYATGLFSRVDIVTLERDKIGIRDLLIQLEDAGPLLLTYGVGVQDREGPRGTVELTHSNLWGLDRALSFRIRGSQREQRFQTTFREPSLFNWDLDGFASLFLERTRQQFFDANRIDFSFQSLKQFANQDSLLVSASFQTVNLRDIRDNDQAVDFPDETGTFHIASIGGSYIRDTRNDSINPRSGNYFTGTLQLADEHIGSQKNFVSFFAQASIYRPAKETVVAASLRFGWSQPYGKTDILPITERYFVGGSTTLRAFGRDQAGTKRGGNALAVLNVEYRFPIPFPISELGGAVFYDTGTNFPHISDFSLGAFTHTAGFGLRYDTPLGPIRLDFGFNLNRQINEIEPEKSEPRNNVTLTLGHTF